MSSFKFIDFDTIFSKAEIDILNDCYSAQLFKNRKNHRVVYILNVNQSDVRRLIYHHVIYYICRYINKHKGEVIVVSSSVIKSSHEIFKYCNGEKFKILLKIILRKVRRLLPICIVMDYPYSDQNINNFKTEPTGEYYEFINYVEGECQKQIKRVKDLQKVKKFAKEYGLKFLSTDYFNSLSAKTLFLK